MFLALDLPLEAVLSYEESWKLRLSTWAGGQVRPGRSQLGGAAETVCSETEWAKGGGGWGQWAARRLQGFENVEET